MCDGNDLRKLRFCEEWNRGDMGGNERDVTVVDVLDYNEQGAHSQQQVARITTWTSARNTLRAITVNLSSPSKTHSLFIGRYGLYPHLFCIVNWDCSAGCLLTFPHLVLPHYSPTNPLFESVSVFVYWARKLVRETRTVVGARAARLSGTYSLSSCSVQTFAWKLLYASSTLYFSRGPYFALYKFFRY